jgi:glyoxylase-like metal-dependent hydrolase (beta-lactamase superfamily II)
VVVDTGYRSNQIMETLGMRGLQSHETMIENQLKKHGLRMGDVRYVLHTHLHIDHAGKDDLFPMNTAVVINRKELEYSVSGLMHPQYPAVDIKHLIDRLHTKAALRFLDLEISGPVELMPGLICEAAGGHTEGSMNIIVKTNEGDATICGDVLYDINDQLVEPFREISDMEPRVTGNHGTTKRQEKAAIKKVVARSRFVLPIHDRAAMIETGQVIGRLQDSIPGPIVQSLPRRNWFPA